MLIFTFNPARFPFPVANPLTRINPRRIARYETENWAAYYQKRWLRLLRVSIGMVKETFRLNWPEAILAAYLVARAEIAAAPFPDNDIPTAEAYMRQFYAFLKRKHHLDYDADEASRRTRRRKSGTVRRGCVVK